MSKYFDMSNQPAIFVAMKKSQPDQNFTKAVEFTYRPKPVLIIGADFASNIDRARQFALNHHPVKFEQIRVQSIKENVKNIRNIHFLVFKDVRITDLNRLLLYADNGVTVGKMHRYPTVIGVMTTSEVGALREFFDVVKVESPKINAVKAPDEITITIDRKRAQSLSHKLADFTCWAQGFLAGTRSIDEYEKHVGMLNHGLESARDLNDMLKRKLPPLD